LLAREKKQAIDKSPTEKGGDKKGEETLKVSDWSQPIKITLAILFMGYFVWWSLEVLALLAEV